MLASGTWLPQPKEIGEFALIDHTGRPLTRSRLAGAPTLVFFGFTHCPDVCPLTLALLRQVRKAQPVPDLRLLMISVDPERDTPEALAQYVSAFDAGIVGATGEPESVRRLAASFGVATGRVDLPGGGYTVDHTAAVFLLDERGRMVAVFTPPLQAGALAEDLRRARSHLRG